MAALLIDIQMNMLSSYTFLWEDSDQRTSRRDARFAIPVESSSQQRAKPHLRSITRSLPPCARSSRVSYFNAHPLSSILLFFHPLQTTAPSTIATISNMSSMDDLLKGTHILSGAESQRLRTFCHNAIWTPKDLDEQARLLQTGPPEKIKAAIEQRISTSSLEDTRDALASIAYGPGEIPIYNFLLQMLHLNPFSRAL